MTDILFKTDEYVFSYRVAGVLLHNNHILLQKPTNDPGFAVPGGHVAFGETNAETLTREFKEEIGADIAVGDLKWVAEIFFPWGDKPCHQLCLYYDVRLCDETQIPAEGVFTGTEQMEGRSFQLEFHWVSMDGLHKIPVYPTNLVQLMQRYDQGMQHGVQRTVLHFVYREE